MLNNNQQQQTSAIRQILHPEQKHGVGRYSKGSPENARKQYVEVSVVIEYVHMILKSNTSNTRWY